MALDEGPARLNQVVNDHHVPPLGLSFLDPHDALGAVANLGMGRCVGGVRARGGERRRVGENLSWRGG
jgi:hypothetical protein